MKKTVCLWIGTGIILLPALALSGSIGSIERPDPVSQRLEGQAKELKQGLSFYRHEGSLWEERRSAFYMDTKARNINDILTVKIEEISTASQQNSTKTERESSILASITKFLGSPLDFSFENLWGKDNSVTTSPRPDDPFEPEIASSAKSSHSGSGKISGSGKLTASVTTKVIEVMPNGNLIVEGRKEVTIDNEKRFIILSGIVRPEDIAFDNTVSSSKVADARIEYTGTGVISDKQRPGIYHRIFDWIYPL